MRAALAHRLPAFALGFAASFFQLLFFREWLSAVSANELTLSILIAEWLLLTGLGALLGLRGSFLPFSLPVLLTAAALLPPVLIAGLRVLRNLVFIRGTEPDLVPFILFSTGLSLPFCLANGFALTRADRLLRESGRGSAYPPDTLGGAAGGLLFAVFFFRLSDPFTAGIAPALFLSTALILKKARLQGLLIFAFCGLLVWLPLEERTLERLYGEKAEKSVSLKEGALRLFGSGNNIVIRQNSALLYASQNPEAAEELAHIPLLQRRPAGKALILSGTLSGVAEEVLKHEPGRVVVVEAGPEKSGLGIEAGILTPHPSLQRIFQDPRRFVETTDERFDVLIIAAPPPVTLSANRYYTAEFFAACKRVLADSGVLAFALPGAAAALGPETREAIALCGTSLGPFFSHVLFFPGARTIVAASNAPLSADLGSLLSQRPLDNRFLTTDRLAGGYSPFRFDLLNSVPAAEHANRDFRPRLFLALQKLAAREFNLVSALLPALLLILPLLFLAWRKKEGFTLFTTAFAVTGAEVLLLTAFEIRYGTLYYAMSFLFAIVLLSLFAGYVLGAKKRVSLRVSEGGVLLALLLLLPAALPRAGALILPCLILTAFMAGFQFAQLLKREPGHFPGLMAADLAGGALGALLTGTLFFPLLGFWGTAAVFAGIKVLSFIR